MPILDVSAKRGDGMSDWLALVTTRAAEFRNAAN